MPSTFALGIFILNASRYMFIMLDEKSEAMFYYITDYFLTLRLTYFLTLCLTFYTSVKHLKMFELSEE